MSEDMFTQYSKERLLKRKYILVHVINLPKKHATGGKTKPLSSQKVGYENGHPKVTWLEHLIMSSRTKKCQSQHMLLHPKKYGDHLVKNE
jgi:hypothetical protein